jgi:hypothetical protein
MHRMLIVVWAQQNVVLCEINIKYFFPFNTKNQILIFMDKEE